MILLKKELFSIFRKCTNDLSQRFLMARRLAHINPTKSLFLMCDIQEKFRPAMPLFSKLIENSKRLTEAGKILNIPLLVTEQNPEKLGKSVKEIDICHATSLVGKTQFSMLVPEVESKMKNLFGGLPSDVVIYGIECHVCVQQTCLELLDRKINVYLPADCVASRVHQDRDIALQYLRSAGCCVTTSESIIYDFLRDKNNPKFNELKKLLIIKAQTMEIN